MTTRSDLPLTTLCSATEESPMDCPSFVDIIPSDMRPTSSSLDTDLIAIKLPEVLPANSTAYLTLYYAVGTASTTGEDSVLSGLIRSGPFVNSTGQPAVLMATRLEPTGARRLFPCYDAPKYRAIYTVDVTAPKDITVLGNTAPMAGSPTDSKKEGEEGMVVTLFKPTAPMPSYMLGLVVGDLKQVSGTNTNTTDQTQSSLLPGGGIPQVEGWVAGDTMGRYLNYAVTAGQEAMAFFSSTDSFAINQPTEITKLDIVAIPGWEGSQEAWGLVMLDEPRAFYNPDQDGEYARYQTTALMCQQAAAQWIGGMVSIDDWTQYGLKEGLTTIAQYRCLPRVAEKAGSGVTLPPHELRLQAHTPSGQAVSPRDGIVETAMDYTSDPLASPIIPISDLGMFDDVAFNNYVYISKSAASFHMLDAFSEINPNWVGMFNTIMKHFVQEFNGKAARYKDFMTVVTKTVDTYSVKDDFYAKQLNGRVFFWIFSTTPEQEREEALNPRDITQSGVRSATIGGWFFRSVYPFIAPRREMINSTNAMVTMLDMGASQQPFCSWLPDPQAAEGVDDGDDEDEVSVLLERAQTEVCFVDPVPWNDPTRSRYYSLLLSQDNLTDCNIGTGTADINVDTRLPGHQEDFKGNITETGWILNHDGNRMFRTDFGEEHLTALLSIIKDMAGGIEETEYQGPATIGQHSADGSDANDTDCKPTKNDVFESNQIVNDVLAFTLQGYGMYTDGKWIVQALDAVAQSNVTVTPEGQFGMLGSAADSIDDLTLLAAVGNCSAALHDLAMDMLQPRTAAIFYALLNKATDTQSVMTHLVGPTILWHSVFHKDDRITRLLCDLIPNTPLAQYLSDTIGGANQTATRNSTTSISTELRAAAYIALAAEPAVCFGTDADAVTAALIECWETSPEYNEAERCLFALPYVVGTEASVDYITSSDGSSVDKLIEAYDGDVEMALRKVERTRLLSRRRPTLLKNTAERSLADWSSAFSSLQEGWQDIVAAEGEEAACLALQGLPAPVTGEHRSGVEQWLRRSPGGVGCAAVIKARVLGRAENTRRLVDDNDLPASLCAALEARG